MCRDRMDKQRTMDFHLMSRMNRFVDRVTHLHDSQLTMKKVGICSRRVLVQDGLAQLGNIGRSGISESEF